MSKFTKAAIMNSFMKLLSENPFDKITVKDIVDDCGINRNTFYYNFQDIYALVDEIMQNEINRIAEMHKQGDALGLSPEELAFYDALTKPEAIKDFYSNDELVSLTRELTETLRKNRTIDWQKKETARAAMRKMVKRLLKKHKYPPEGMDDALETVMSQCEMWTDNE